ncbi:MAG: hypothetical protein AAF561_14050 [Planctomycetota bacterium]
MSRAPVHLAFYRGGEHGRMLDRLVARHDPGPHSHVELVFDERPRLGTSVCFSSSWRDGGVRFKRLQLGGDRADRWDLVPVRLGPRQVDRLRRWCVNQVGGRYDIPGVLAFKWPCVRHRLNWWFCSEIMIAALQRVGLLEDLVPQRFTPNGLFHHVTKELAR